MHQLQELKTINQSSKMTKLHKKHPEFTYSASRPFVKHRERIQKFKEESDSNYIYKKKLYKTCFAYDAVYADSKNLTKITVLDRVLNNRAYKIALNPKYDEYIYADSKNLTKITVLDRVLNNRAYKIALNPKHDEYLKKDQERV